MLGGTDTSQTVMRHDGDGGDRGAVLTADSGYIWRRCRADDRGRRCSPEGAALPALTFQIVGGRANPGLTNSGPQRWRVQFDVRAEDAVSAAGSGRENVIRKVLNGFSGVPVVGAPWVDILLIQALDYFDNEARQFRKGAEFYVISFFAAVS